MHRVLALLLALTLSGCAIRGEGHEIAYVIDGVGAGVGGYALYETRDAVDDPGAGLLKIGGVVLILASLVGAVVNGSINAEPKPKPAPAPATNTYPYVPHPS